MFQRSYSRDYDDTFEPGPLTMDVSDYLDVSVVEIWGFPDIDTIKKFEEFKIRKLKKKNASATQTKKALFSGGFNEDMFLNNLMKHKKDVAVDLDYEKTVRKEENNKNINSKKDIQNKNNELKNDNNLLNELKEFE